MQQLKYSFILRLLLVSLCVYCILLIGKLTRYKSDNVVEEPKTILFGNAFFGIPDYNFGMGQKPFLDYKCPVSNCFITNNRKFVKKFDAVLFHGPEFNENIKNLPYRDPSQIYVYVSMESPVHCVPYHNLNVLFNMTMTYRIDSDILMPYLYFTDMSKNIISPSLDPKWITPDMDESFLNNYLKLHEKKSKPIAWFVSNCDTKGKRESKVEELQKFIQVDIYGKCGDLECPRTNNTACLEMLKNDYYFYLSYENSLCTDYITEKIAKAYRSNLVPIVYGGADYSRFLPPHSYIDSRKYSASELATFLKHLIDNPKEYVKYFWWKKYYNTDIDFDKSIKPFCKLCEILNGNTWKPKTYNMLEWWYGTNDKPVCKTPEIFN